MTTINPVQTPVTQAPAFRGKTTKAQQKLVDTANKAFRDFQIKEMMKTDPERAKVMIMRDCIAKDIFSEILKSVEKGNTLMKEAETKILNLMKNI